MVPLYFSTQAKNNKERENESPRATLLLAGADCATQTIRGSVRGPPRNFPSTPLSRRYQTNGQGLKQNLPTGEPYSYPVP